MGNNLEKADSIVKEFKACCAIDFGSDGCALAFGYKGEVRVYNKWKTTKRKRTHKTKTQILLSDENEVIAFGHTAKVMYSNLEGRERKTWKFFERFKMSLYFDPQQTEVEESDVRIDVGDTLTALNGAKCPAKIVFVAALQYLQGIARTYLDKMTKEDGITIEDDAIQWIITVPSIWNYKSKQRMKEWMISAGLVNQRIKDQYMIVYEPECAALAIQKEHELYANMDRNENDKYILMDAGGGTMDVVCHEIMSNDMVEEVYCASGGPFGGGYIDDQYIVLLQCIFGTKWMEQFKSELPNVYVEIIDNFQIAKERFYMNEEATVHSVQLPYELLQFMNEASDRQTNALPTSIQYYRNLLMGDMDSKCADAEDEVRIDIEEECLTMSVSIWKCIFDSYMNKIIQHTKQLLEIDSVNGCKHLYLCGGFAASPYFQARMMDEFGKESHYKLNVNIPPNPALVVVRGAAYYGLQPKAFVQSRISRYTYGINTYLDRTDAHTIGVPQSYMESKENRSEDGLVKDCFRIIVRKQDKINMDTRCIIRGMYGKGQEDTKTVIPILYSEATDPKVRKDGFELGQITIQHDETTWYQKGQKEELTIEFCFGDTLFKVYSYPVNQRHRKIELKISY
eukprot:846798_1